MNVTELKLTEGTKLTD